MLFGIAAAKANGPKLVWQNKFYVDFFSTAKTGFSSNAEYFAIGGNKGAVTVYECATGEVYDVYRSHSSQVFCALFQPGGNVIVSGDKDGNLVIYDYVQKKLKMVVAAHKGAVTALTFSKDGELMVTGSRDNTIRIWEVLSGKMVKEITGINGNIISVRITPDKKTVVAGTRALMKGLRIFDVASGVEKAALESANLQSLDISTDGRWIATANLAKNVYVWDIKKQSIAIVLQGHVKNLNDVAFSPSGTFLVSSSDDHTAIIWDMEKKRSLGSIIGRKHMTGLAFSPDDRYLATMNEDGTLSMWDMSEILYNMM